MLSKANLLVLNLSTGVCKGLRGRSDIDQSIFEFTLRKLVADGEHVNDRKSDEELDSKV